LKYGSLANTAQQTAYYQVSHAYDESVIGTNVYAALSTGQKKYWSPIVNSNDVVISYQRKVLDTVVETNQVVQLTGSFANIATSTVINQGSNTTGTVSFANATTIALKHITGTWANATATYLTSSGMLANATITSANVVHHTIPANEMTYWTAVSVYASESMNNENRRHIRLLNSAYVNVVERDMKDLL
jgi:hypothetical protein